MKLVLEMSQEELGYLGGFCNTLDKEEITDIFDNWGNTICYTTGKCEYVDTDEVSVDIMDKVLWKIYDALVEQGVIKEVDKYNKHLEDKRALRKKTDYKEGR